MFIMLIKINSRITFFIIFLLKLKLRISTLPKVNPTQNLNTLPKFMRIIFKTTKLSFQVK